MKPKSACKGKFGTVEQRDDVARRALAMARRGASMLDIATEFDCSLPTAKNLVSRGKWLED